MSALGFIETKGLLAAIEGADAMLKAADVRLLEKHLVGGGLVTITITGEVSAVRASVDAAMAAIGRIEGAVLVSEHVIPRPDEGVSTIISLKQPAPQAEPVEEKVEEPAPAPKPAPEVVDPQPEEAPVVEAKEAPVEEAPEAPAPEVEEAKEPEAPKVEKAPEVVATPAPKAEEPKYTASRLKKMKVKQLRQIAQSLEEISMTKSEIKAATKKKLIEAIVKVTG